MPRRLAPAAALLLAGAVLPGSPPQQTGGGQRSAPTSLSVDPAFFELSAATGGDFYFWSPGEFARSRLEIPLGGEDLLFSYGTLHGERWLEVPVDTLLARLDLFVGAEVLEEALFLQPNGSPLAGGARARIQTFDRMRIATVERPACGLWRIRVRGRGLACVTARGGADHHTLSADQAPILLVDLAFVALGGRPGHEGWFPLERAPRTGEELTLRLDLCGSFASAELGFVARDGRSLGSDWVPLEPEAQSDTVYVSCVIPDQPFRALVRGFDVSGAPFQRVHAPCLTPDPGR